eukprot:366029-Chlamydomonas_euryale.AAC.49
MAVRRRPRSRQQLPWAQSLAIVLPSARVPVPSARGPCPVPAGPGNFQYVVKGKLKLCAGPADAEAAMAMGTVLLISLTIISEKVQSSDIWSLHCSSTCEGTLLAHSTYHRRRLGAPRAPRNGPARSDTAAAQRGREVLNLLQQTVDLIEVTPITFDVPGFA